MTRNAAVQETVKVSAKYETAGCWQIKEDFAAEVDGESMVNEGCYSSRPRGTMSEFSNEVDVARQQEQWPLFHLESREPSSSGLA